MNQHWQLAGLLDGRQAAGIYRVIGQARVIVATLERSGWQVGLAALPSRAGLLESIAAALHFPPYFGNNLDALWDCLTDLTEPTALVITGWGEPALAEPDQWRRVLAVLEERTQVGSPFAVVLA